VGVGSLTLTQNGACVSFPTLWNGIAVAGGGTESCDVHLFADRGCGQLIGSIGPITDPNLGPCISGWNINGNPTDEVAAAMMINCPE
jgi:hypothetical protein